MQEILDKLSNYTFRGMIVPTHLHEQIALYAVYGIQPSGFLNGLILKDISTMMNHADDEVLHNIPAVYAFFFNHLPSAIWGNQKWMDLHSAATKQARDAFMDSFPVDDEEWTPPEPPEQAIITLEALVVPGEPQTTEQRGEDDRESL
jgi:hypothetical protein